MATTSTKTISLRQTLFNCQRTNETTAKRFSSTIIGEVISLIYPFPEVNIPILKELLGKWVDQGHDLTNYR